MFGTPAAAPKYRRMPQPEGSSSTNTGRIGAQIGTAAVAASFALGAGWGSTASVSVAAGSNDQAGIITVTSAGTGQAQATANVTFTFSDGAYAATPRSAIVTLMSSSNAVTEAQPTNGAVSTTALSWRHSVLPVAAATYKYSYLVIA
jgi:hypothetical protein